MGWGSEGEGNMCNNVNNYGTGKDYMEDGGDHDSNNINMIIIIIIMLARGNIEENNGKTAYND